MRSLAVVVALAACGDNRAAPIDAAVDATDATADACTRNCTVAPKFYLRRIATTSGGIMLATSPPGDSRRLFLVQQNGQIEILENGELHATPFLDLTSIIQLGSVQLGTEQGLLGLAFHPDYVHNGTFYVFYTTLTANILARYHVGADPDIADPTGTIVLSIPDPYPNHNAGMLEFGSDGYLYVSTGDGGSGGDPLGNGQNTHALLAKILRLDVDHPAAALEYGIPPSNPFADGIAGAPEVFIYGLRNPWRWSFDRVTGDLWIGDVGQNKIEELDYIPAAQANGLNLGWNMYEGSDCYQEPCSPDNIRMPQFQRDHANDGWCAIIGGAVYRGNQYPDLLGTYFFTDYCAHDLATAKPGLTGVDVEWPPTSVIEPMLPPAHGSPAGPASIHPDDSGELYLTTTDGHVYHIEEAP